MGAQTKIGWVRNTDGTQGMTFNPWRGCMKVSPGCTHCYAETMSHRNPAVLGEWGPQGTRAIAADSYWRKPARWNAQAAEQGIRIRIFCSSLADVFEDNPQVVDARASLMDLIAATPHLDWLLLTKRIENVWGMVPATWRAGGFPPNVWMGTSVENQRYANERVPVLLGLPAAVRFLSCEPLLGPVDLTAIPRPYDDQLIRFDALRGLWHSQDGFNPGWATERLQWVIAGGESGAQARIMLPRWAQALRDQCVAAEVPYFFKQWGEYAPVNADTPMPAGEADRRLVGVRADSTRVHPDDPISHVDTWMWRAGKHTAGNTLDGATWEQLPAVPQ